MSDRVAYNVYFGGGSWATLYLKPHKNHKCADILHLTSYISYILDTRDMSSPHAWCSQAVIECGHM